MAEAATIHSDEDVNSKISELEYYSNASEEVEQISQERGSPSGANLSNRVDWASRLDAMDRDKRLVQKGPKNSLENEKDSIMKGFMIEKQLMSREHEREKELLIDDFTKDRHKLIDKFRGQLEEIEEKLDRKNGYDAEYDGESPTNKMNTAGRKGPGAIFLKLNGDKVVTPEGFLSMLDLEDKYENDKEKLERNFRKEKRELKEKLEEDYERKLQAERFRYDFLLDEIQRDANDLKAQKRELQTQLKQQNKNLDRELSRKRSELEAKVFSEKDALGRKLEEKHLKELQIQKQSYDKLVQELKEDLIRVTTVMDEREQYFAKMYRKQREYHEDFKEKLSNDMKGEFEKEFRRFKDANETLSQNIETLKIEKEQLTQKINELERGKSEDSRILKDFSERLNTEYEIKLRNCIQENQKLKVHIEDLARENDALTQTLRDREREGKTVENELCSKSYLTKEYEEKISMLRDENTKLSSEITTLRKEKDKLSIEVDSSKKAENKSNSELAKRSDEIKDWSERCKISEREKLQLERVVSTLRGELEKLLNEKREKEQSILHANNEIGQLRKLLNDERKEQERLNHRFQQDAMLIRRKDSEQSSLKSELDDVKNDFNGLKSELVETVNKLRQAEAKNMALEAKLVRAGNTKDYALRHERVNLQQQFAKEYAKRLDEMRSNYERGTDGLRRQIHMLRSKISELEVNLLRRETASVLQRSTSLETFHSPRNSGNSHLKDSVKDNHLSLKTNGLAGSSDPGFVYKLPSQQTPSPTGGLNSKALVPAHYQQHQSSNIDRVSMKDLLSRSPKPQMAKSRKSFEPGSKDRGTSYNGYVRNNRAIADRSRTRGLTEQLDYMPKKEIPPGSSKLYRGEHETSGYNSIGFEHFSNSRSQNYHRKQSGSNLTNVADRNTLTPDTINPTSKSNAENRVHFSDSVNFDSPSDIASTQHASYDSHIDDGILSKGNGKLFYCKPYSEPINHSTPYFRYKESQCHSASTLVSEDKRPLQKHSFQGQAKPPMCTDNTGSSSVERDREEDPPRSLPHSSRDYHIQQTGHFKWPTVHHTTHQMNGEPSNGRNGKSNSDWISSLPPKYRKSEIHKETDPLVDSIRDLSRNQTSLENDTRKIEKAVMGLQAKLDESYEEIKKSLKTMQGKVIN